MIIGGGPAGLRLAGNLSGKGYRIALFESKPNLEDKTLRAIRKRVFDGWNLNRNCIRSVCRGVRLYSLHAAKVSEDAQFYFAEFGSMLKVLLERVSDVALNFSHTVLDVVSEEGRVILHVRGPKGVVKHFCQVLVACDGVNGMSRRILGGGPRFIKAIEYRLAGGSTEPGYFDLFYTHRFHPGGYGWVRNLEDWVDIGLAASRDPVKLLNEFIRKHSIPKGKGFARRKVVWRFGGLLPLSRGKLVADRVVFVGDSAAGFAFIGGSVEEAVKSADLVVEPLEKVLDGDPTALKEYELLWDRTFAHRSTRQEEVRKSLDALTDSEIDETVKGLENINDFGEQVVRCAKRNSNKQY